MNIDCKEGQQVIRSSKHSLKFTNKKKINLISLFVNEYRRVCGLLLDNIWESSHTTLSLPKFLPKDNYPTLDTWLSARIIQCCSNQILGLLNSTYEKRRKQLYVLKKLQRLGQTVKFLQSKIDRQPIVKPRADNIFPCLDSRFVDFLEDPKRKFLFVRISSIGNKTQIRIPIKETTPSLKWKNLGTRKASVRLTKTHIFLAHEIERAPMFGSSVVGADQGISTVLSLSDGQTTSACPHGHTLSSIQKRLSRKKKGSKGFARTVEHRKNHINWSLNRLNFNDIKEVRLEKLHNIRKGTKVPRFLSHFRYTLIKEKLIRLSEEKGFLLREVPNEFRSQRCSKCGWVRKANRKGKTFKCTLCHHTQDADLNAASNLKLDLIEIPFWVRLRKLNREGFFWNAGCLTTKCQEKIIPDARENKLHSIC